MDRLADLVKALARAGWRPISVVNVVATCGVVLAVLRLPLDPAPTVRNFVPLGVLVGFVLVCMAFIAFTADERHR